MLEIDHFWGKFWSMLTFFGSIFNIFRKKGPVLLIKPDFDPIFGDFYQKRSENHTFGPRFRNRFSLFAKFVKKFRIKCSNFILGHSFPGKPTQIHAKMAKLDDFAGSISESSDDFGTFPNSTRYRPKSIFDPLFSWILTFSGRKTWNSSSPNGKNVKIWLKSLKKNKVCT